jgi:hypothetical protein
VGWDYYQEYWGIFIKKTVKKYPNHLGKKLLNFDLQKYVFLSDSLAIANKFRQIPTKAGIIRINKLL